LIGNLQSEGFNSLLGVATCILHKGFVVAFSYTTKKNNCTTKENHVVQKFGNRVHLGNFPSLTNIIAGIINSWKHFVDESYHV
jgi:hypothetical protein